MVNKQIYWPIQKAQWRTVCIFNSHKSILNHCLNEIMKIETLLESRNHVNQISAIREY